MKICFLLLFIFALGNCAFFPKEMNLLATHITSQGDTIQVIHVALGATTGDVIHVKALKNDRLIKVIEGHNYLNSSLLINDSTLKLVFTDSILLPDRRGYD